MMKKIFLFALVVGIAIPNLAHAVSLTSYYRLDETSGTTAFNSAGSNGDATYENLGSGLGKTGSPGNPGGFSIEFPTLQNQNRRVLVPTSGGLVAAGSSGDFTITMWVQLRDLTRDNVLATNGDINTGTDLLWFRDEDTSTSGVDNSMAAIIDGGPRANAANNAFNDTDWHLVALSYDNSLGSDTVRMFIDGVRTSSLTTSENGVIDNIAISVGNEAVTNDRPIDGFLDEVAFWDRALSDGEMAALNFFADDPDTPSVDEFLTDAEGAATLFDFFENGAEGDTIIFDDPLGFMFVSDVTDFGGSADQSALIGNTYVLGLDGVAGLVSFQTPEPASIALWTMLGLLGFAYGWRRAQVQRV